MTEGATALVGAAVCEQAALRDVASHVRLWGVAIVGLVIDLWSKHWAFHTLRQGGHRTIVPNVLEWHITMNPGALFGIGSGQTEVFLVASVLALALVMWMFSASSRRSWLMHIALGGILAGAIGNMYDRATVQLVMLGVQTPAGPVPRYYEKTGLVENDDGDEMLILQEYPVVEGTPVRSIPLDRVDELPPTIGYVRDFIKIPTRWFGGNDIWPWVFNVADMLLVGGVGILAIRMFADRRQHGAIDDESPPSQPTTTGTPDESG